MQSNSRQWLEWSRKYTNHRDVKIEKWRNTRELAGSISLKMGSINKTMKHFLFGEDYSCCCEHRKQSCLRHICPKWDSSHSKERETSLPLAILLFISQRGTFAGNVCFPTSKWDGKASHCLQLKRLDKNTEAVVPPRSPRKGMSPLGTALVFLWDFKKNKQRKSENFIRVAHCLNCLQRKINEADSRNETQ